MNRLAQILVLLGIVLGVEKAEAQQMACMKAELAVHLLTTVNHMRVAFRGLTTTGRLITLMQNDEGEWVILYMMPMKFNDETEETLGACFLQTGTNGKLIGLDEA